MGRTTEKPKARKEEEDVIFRRLSSRWHRTEVQESPQEDLLPNETARPALEARAPAEPVGTEACVPCVTSTGQSGLRPVQMTVCVTY